MNLDTLRSSLQRHRIAVALWLALLLPCGLSAATTHLLSHFGAAAAAQLDSGAPGLDDTRCDRCLAAAAVAGLAPPSTGFTLGHAMAIGAVQMPSALRAIAVAPRLGYRSRAPPVASR